MAAGVLVTPRSALASPPSQPLEEGQHFTIDPVADGLLIVGGAGFSGLLSLVLSTGEIAPAPPGDPNNLLSIDRGAVSQTIDKNAATFSDIGLYTAVGFAVLDPILSGLRDGWDAGLVDAVLYAETLSLAETLTDITKIAVRRPRPIDYINCPATSAASSGCKSTDLQLSFFSGHASTVASIGATATYLAFERSPGTVRPWLTLGVSVGLTSFVSYERVRSGAHFPTDVIAGAMAGAAVGVLVPHLHRHKSEAPPVWIGASPTPGGGEIAVGGAF
jgi:undecaprenyl-diphosphatase